jgi:hypothetical protein
MGKIFGHGVHVITGKCRVLPMGAFFEGEMHLVMDAIVSYPIHFLLLLDLFILIVFSCALRKYLRITVLA